MSLLLSDLGPSTESNRVLNEYDYFTSLCNRTCTPLIIPQTLITRNCNHLLTSSFLEVLVKRGTITAIID